MTGPYSPDVKPVYPICNAIGCFFLPPQSRPKSRRSVFSEAGELMQINKFSVFLTPEGKRSPSGRILAFNKGAFHLSIATQRPVVPLFFVTPDNVSPGRGYRPQRGQVEVFVGSPIVPPMLEVSEEKIQSFKTFCRSEYQKFQEKLENDAIPETWRINPPVF